MPPTVDTLPCGALSPPSVVPVPLASWEAASLCGRVSAPRLFPVCQKKVTATTVPAAARQETGRLLIAAVRLSSLQHVAVGSAEGRLRENSFLVGRRGQRRWRVRPRTPGALSAPPGTARDRGPRPGFWVGSAAARDAPSRLTGALAPWSTPARLSAASQVGGNSVETVVIPKGDEDDTQEGSSSRGCLPRSLQAGGRTGTGRL